MTATIKYPVAELAGTLVWAAEAAERAERPAGLQCVSCGEEVILRSGESRRPHFSHKPDSTCTGGETALHRTAIRTIAEGILAAAGGGRTYPFTHTCSHCDVTRIGNLARDVESTIEIDRPLANAIRPDILVRGGDGTPPYVIEVVVTHAPEDGALAEYVSQGLPVIVVRPNWDTMESLRTGLTALATQDSVTGAVSVEVLGRCRFPRHLEPEDGELRECPTCDQPARLVALEVSEMACWANGCSRKLRVLDTYALIYGERVLIAAGARDLQVPSEIAKALGVRLEDRYSKKAAVGYRGNICECGVLCGDNFAYAGFRGEECTPLSNQGVHRYVVCSAGHWTFVSKHRWAEGVHLSRKMNGVGVTGESAGMFGPSLPAHVSVTTAEIRDIARMMTGFKPWR
jgi:hypothetical protein